MPTIIGEALDLSPLEELFIDFSFETSVVSIATVFVVVKVTVLLSSRGVTLGFSFGGTGTWEGYIRRLQDVSRQRFQFHEQHA